MADSATAALHAAVEELEAHCAAAERALVALDWEQVSLAFGDQLRVTHMLSIMLADPPTELTPGERLEIEKRLRAVLVFRDDQLARLKVYHAGIASRLTNVAQFKDAARTLGVSRPASKLGNLDQLR